MITPEYAQTLARYAHWQNESVFGAAESLSVLPGSKVTGACIKMRTKILNSPCGIRAGQNKYGYFIQNHLAQI